MLLHNQLGRAVSWEDYSWEPYGSCEVQDEHFAHMKAQGFPVDVAPVPPKQKAERAAAEMTSDAQTVEIEKLRKQVADSESVATEAKRAAEASDIRATSVRAEVEVAKDRVRVLEEENRAMRSDAGEYDKMVADLSGEVSRLKEQLQLELARQTLPKGQPQQQQQPDKSKR